MWNWIVFIISYWRLKRRFNELFVPYLKTGRGRCSISLLRKKIILKHYSIRAVSAQNEIIDYINVSFPFYKCDEVFITPIKMEFRASKLPEVFYPPRSYKAKKGTLLLGCDSKGKPIEISTKNYSSMAISIFSGGGKTTLIQNLLKVQSSQEQFFRYVVVDVKREGDFDFLKDLKVNHVILGSLEQTLEFYKTLKLEVEEGRNVPTFIIFEEAPQFLDKGKFLNSKTLAKASAELASIVETSLQTWRSRQVFTLLTTQSMNITDWPIDTSNIQIKIFGYISKAQAQVNGIPAQYANRPDLKHSKFLFYRSGHCELMRGVQCKKI